SPTTTDLIIPSLHDALPIYCGDSDIPALAVIPTSDLTVNWYDSAIGGNLLLENSFNFVPPGPGTYYAGYASEEFTCVGDYRTPRSEEHTSELQSRENLVCRL